MGTESHSQYALDFQSGTNERRALLLSALGAAGQKRLTPLALLVFNMQERGDRPLEWSADRIAADLGCDVSTARRWIRRLWACRILAKTERRYQDGGQTANQLGIDWDGVERIATGSDRVGNSADRVGIVPSRVGKMPTPNKESLSESLSRINTSTTSALPHASTGGGNEEEDFLKRLADWCRKQIPHGPRRLDEALRIALSRGFTHKALVDRCTWFAKHYRDWQPEHRGGAFYAGLAEATPELAPNHGWPYQR